MERATNAFLLCYEYTKKLKGIHDKASDIRTLRMVIIYESATWIKNNAETKFSALFFW